jgi:Zn-dependent protease
MPPAFILSLSFHEFCHALTATTLGDNTPKKMGRLTLNPIAHIDFLGLLFLILFRVGWAKPVVFDHRNFKHKKTYSILTALAGPFSNFLFALICMYILRYLPHNLLPFAVAKSITQVVQATVYVNIMLGVFNLLPFPPLDGSHILMVFITEKFPEVAQFIHRYSFFILLGLFFFPPTRMLLTSLFVAMQNILNFLVI